jgi:hypothetical protein
MNNKKETQLKLVSSEDKENLSINEIYKELDIKCDKILERLSKVKLNKKVVV